MFRFLFKIFLVLVLSINILYAEIVKKITVSGNKRISNETIILFSEVSVSENIDDNDLDSILKNLFETNFFKDIFVSLDNGILKIKVLENPIIQTISFEGVKKKSLIDALEKILSLKEKSSFIEVYAKKDLVIIKKSLKKIGYYFSEVELSLQENNNNTVNLIYNVQLGKKASIKKIKFVGNKLFKDRKLRDVIVSEEDKFWKFLSNKKYLDEQRVNLDKRLLKNYYLNKGYFNVSIESSSASFLDENNFELVFNINSGNKYFFNNFDLIIPEDYKKENFKQIFKIFSDIKNSTYSYNKIEKILDEIDSIALSKQYQFIDASVEETIVGDNKINFSIIINETEKYYVEKINIFGNSITREDVIRNVFIVDEGDPYNKILHNKSLNALKGKNIFSKVESKVIDGSTANQKIININIEEKATGEISAGAGVGTSGTTVSFGVKENNFQGKGVKLNTNVAIATDTLQGTFSITVPNYKYSNNSLTTSLERTQIDKLTINGYKTARTGIGIGTGFEQYENFYFTPSLNILNEKVETNSSASANYKKQEGSYFDTDFSYGLTYDVRDQGFQPTEGYKTSFYQTVPIISDDFSIVNQFQFNSYKELFNDMIGSFSFYAKTVNSLQGNDVRVSKRIFLPTSKLRGFERSKIGPKDGTDYVGGNYATAINLSTTLPNFLPTLQNTDFKLFIDAANVWGVDYSESIDNSSKIRSSTGVSIDWFTPLGPLNFAFSYPISKAKTDITESFRFNLGTTF